MIYNNNLQNFFKDCRGGKYVLTLFENDFVLAFQVKYNRDFVWTDKSTILWKKEDFFVNPPVVEIYWGSKDVERHVAKKIFKIWKALEKK